MGVSPIDTVLGRRGGVLRLVLELVCGMLTTQDRNNFVLVCQLWREVGEEPRFCYMGILSLTREKLNTISERLDCRRMRFVREIRVEEGVKVSEEVLQAVARHKGLKKLVMFGTDLSTVEKGQMSTVIKRLEEVDISHTKLTVQQLEAIMTAICAGDCLLKSLKIAASKLSTVNHSLLTSAVNKLDEVNLSSIGLTVQQLEAIMTAIVDGDCLVKSLNIERNNLSTVNQILLTSAVKMLKKVNITATDMTDQQMEAIMTAIGDGGCSVKSLNISNNNLSTVNKTLLASAVNMLEELNLFGTKLTVKQLEAVMTAIFDGDCLLKSLDLSMNNLSAVNPIILTSAVSRLEKVDLFETQLTVQQVEAIMTAIAGDECLLKTLKILRNKMHTVNPCVMALAVNSLESIEMSTGHMSLHQVEAILTKSLEKTSLKSLYLVVDYPFLILDEYMLTMVNLAIGHVVIESFFGWFINGVHRQNMTIQQQVKLPTI